MAPQRRRAKDLPRPIERPYRRRPTRALAYTHYDFDDGDLMLRIGPRRDGAPLVVEVRSLTRALAEANRILALA